MFADLHLINAEIRFVVQPGIEPNAFVDWVGVLSGEDRLAFGLSQTPGQRFLLQFVAAACW